MASGQAHGRYSVLVGQGLEKPSIVRELLDVEKNPRRPTYEMATDTPLVLWDCIFPHEMTRTGKTPCSGFMFGDGPRGGDLKIRCRVSGLMEDLWKIWREEKN